MAYEPTVWNTGDTITAEKLNKLENGVGSSGSENSGLIVGNIIATDILASYSDIRIKQPVLDVISRIRQNRQNNLPSYVTIDTNADVDYADSPKVIGWVSIDEYSHELPSLFFSCVVPPYLEYNDGMSPASIEMTFYFGEVLNAGTGKMWSVTKTLS